MEGTFSVALAGADGIPVEVEEDGNAPVSAEVVCAEMTGVLRSLGTFLNSTNSGEAEEIVLRTEKYFVILRVINKEYYLFSLLSSDGNLGKARYLLRKSGEKLKKEL